MNYQTQEHLGWVDSLIEGVASVASSVSGAVGATQVSRAQTEAVKAQARTDAQIAGIQADTAKMIADMNKPKTDDKTMMYVGGGILAVVLLGGLVMAVKK